MTLLVQNEKMLEREAVYFHAAFFREKLHPDVVERYIAANRTCIPAVDSQTLSSIETILSCRLDVEAVEYAFRLKDRHNVLTKKIQVLFYMVEVRSAYFGHFFNCRPKRLGAAADIFYAIALTVYKAIKGKYLIRRYGLA
ncbi:MAG TPA: hypothetical protein VEF34_18930 [Syntrophobacteraceae bacterium]|nr:hypothetical protein [Syntrophobacteraceae bacterium]